MFKPGWRGAWRTGDNDYVPVWQVQDAINTPGSDCAPAINAAIAQANSSGGGVVYLAPGTHYITTSIVLKSGVALVGDKPSTTVIKLNSNAIASLTAYDSSTRQGSKQYCMLIPDHASAPSGGLTGVRVSGVRVDGNSSAQTGSGSGDFSGGTAGHPFSTSPGSANVGMTGIALYKTNGAILDLVEVTDILPVQEIGGGACASFGVLAVDAQNYVLDNCKITICQYDCLGVRGDGTYIPYAPGGKYVNCYFGRAQRGSAQLAFDSRYHQFTNCVFDNSDGLNTACGMYCHGSKDVSFVNCRFVSSAAAIASHAVHVFGNNESGTRFMSERVRLVGCELLTPAGASTGATLSIRSQYVSDIVVDGCNVTNQGTSALSGGCLAMGLLAGGDGMTRNTTVANTTFRYDNAASITTTPIQVVGASGDLISNVRFVGCSFIGATFNTAGANSAVVNWQYTTDCTMHGCTIRGVQRLYATTTFNKGSGADSYDTAGQTDGVSTSGSSFYGSNMTNCVFSSNAIVCSAYQGVDCFTISGGSDNIITNNSFINANNANVITLTGSATRVTVANNRQCLRPAGATPDWFGAFGGTSTSQVVFSNNGNTGIVRVHDNDFSQTNGKSFATTPGTASTGSVWRNNAVKTATANQRSEQSGASGTVSSATKTITHDVYSWRTLAAEDIRITPTNDTLASTQAPTVTSVSSTQFVVTLGSYASGSWAFSWSLLPHFN